MDYKKIKLYKKGYEDGYEEGINTAWDLCRKLALSTESGGLSYADICDIFGMSIDSVIESMTAKEACDKLNEWEKKKAEKIHVGDEVYYKDKNVHFIVTSIIGRKVYGIGKDGLFCESDIYYLEKTGRSFTSDLSNLLSMIGEVEE